MKRLIRLLHEGGHSLVVGNDTVRTFDGRGVSDLYRLLTEDSGELRGASVADKVVGKGAAALMIIGHIERLYADIISEQAFELLLESSVKVTYGQKVSHIINRSGTGWCPIETLCRDCKTAEECLPLIQKFMNELKI